MNYPLADLVGNLDKNDLHLLEEDFSQRMRICFQEKEFIPMSLWIHLRNFMSLFRKKMHFFPS